MEVQISADVWSSCLAHALSTENEEIMGLLLGDCFEKSAKGKIDQQDLTRGRKQGKVVAIWGSMAFRRSDRRKDRVEISAEQLYAGSKQAEVRECGCFC